MIPNASDRAHRETSVDPDPDAFVSAHRRRHLTRWQASEGADETRFVPTDDGWRLALSRYLPKRHAPAHAVSQAPVLLCSGLGANRHTWDLDPQVSFARYLAAEGYDVFVVELRGHGRSEKPPYGGKRYGWGFYDYVQRDLPAAVGAACEVTGAPTVHWMGHSMGGIAVMAALAMGERRLRTVTTMASAIDYSDTGSHFDTLIRLLPLTRVLRAVPLGPFASLFAPVALATHNPIDRFNVHPPNVDRALYRRLTAIGFHPISSPVLQQLATAFRYDGLRLLDGSSCAERLAQSRDLPPVLSIAGTRDPQCSPAAARRHGDHHRVLGRVHGQVEDYGHFDLLMGERAEQEVWPGLVDWLRQHGA